MQNAFREPRYDSAPRIALPEPTSTDPAYNQRAWAPYFHALASSGAVGVPIPLDASPATIAKLFASCSGVLLPGSPADVNPQKYGAVTAPVTAPADPAREAVDELLLRDAFDHLKPLFGICYGIQALNVWRGGTLVQHLPPITTVDHDPGPGILSAHSVRITGGSRLAAIVGDSEDLVSIIRDESAGDERADRERGNFRSAVVNSSHHQAVDRVGDGLAVSARCYEDGVIEALEGTANDHYVVGVQWHPERSYDASEASRHLFRAFVNAVEQYHPRAVESLAL